MHVILAHANDRTAGGVRLERSKLGTMNKHQASRTLLKSPPELWAECSDAQSLTRHLDAFFGEIRITRLEPESTVAWEGERGSGTVKLEPSGWGTRVTLTCSADAVEQPAPGPETPRDPEPVAASDPEPLAASDLRPAGGSQQPAAEAGHGRLLTRMMRFLAPQRRAEEPPAPPRTPTAPVPAPAPPQPAATTPVAPEQAGDRLVAALDSLGQAHHRPFSRA
jgi:hypothetical protein